MYSSLLCGRYRLPVAVALLACLAGVSRAQSQNVVRVEEDWELVITEPAPEADAPQVTCVISPYAGSTETLHAAFELNCRSLPSFVPGGLQLQAWYDETFITRNSAEAGELATPGEVIAWTTKMELNNGRVYFEVNGTSQTWGAFGAGGDLRLSLASSLTDLSGYSPDTSASQSGIGYASNRVSSLVLKEVRYYDADGALVAQDTTPRVVHELAQ